MIDHKLQLRALKALLDAEGVGRAGVAAQKKSTIASRFRDIKLVLVNVIHSCVCIFLICSVLNLK